MSTPTPPPAEITVEPLAADVAKMDERLNEAQEIDDFADLAGEAIGTLKMLVQTLTDPENQPNQFGIVSAKLLHEARRDQGRLDWLLSDHSRGQALRVQGSELRGWSVIDCADGLVILSRAPTYREAIDSAMAATTNEGKPPSPKPVEQNTPRGSFRSDEEAMYGRNPRDHGDEMG